VFSKTWQRLEEDGIHQSRSQVESTRGGLRNEKSSYNGKASEVQREGMGDGQVPIHGHGVDLERHRQVAV
jgi:hypothetical protein